MCKNTHCFSQMDGHGAQIGSMSDLMGFLASLHGLVPQDAPKEKSHEQFIADAIAESELSIRANEMALDILKAGPPEEGAKLVGLESRKPHDPEKFGVDTIATYELTSGGFRVIGKDHLTQVVIDHSTPNIAGLSGLIKAVKHELDKTAQDYADKLDEQAA